MVKVTAATSFYGNEGMWRAGETKEVSNHRAHELIEQGHVIEAADQTGTDLHAEPSALQQVADAIGATVAETPTEGLHQVAEALGATVKTEADPEELTPVTTESTKQKPKAKKAE